MSGRQPDTPLQILKPRIAAQRVQPRVDLQQGQPPRAIVVDSLGSLGPAVSQEYIIGSDPFPRTIHLVTDNSSPSNVTVAGVRSGGREPLLPREAY